MSVPVLRRARMAGRGLEQRHRSRDVHGLAQRADVIQHPKRAAVRGEDQVLIMDDEIAHGSVRQIKLQRLPVLAVVEGDPDRPLGACEKQAMPHRILAHRIDGSILRQPGGRCDCQLLPPSRVR